MNDNIHNQNADLYDLIQNATDAKAIAEDLRSGNVRPELLEQKEEDYRTLLKEILTIADRIRDYDVIALWD